VGAAPVRARLPGPALLLAGAWLLAGCAGATLGSGVGDRYLEHPPWQAGRPARSAGPVGHLPVAWQRGAAQAPVFDPADGPDSPVQALLDDLNHHLARMGATVPLEPGRARRGTPPDVMFGCAPDAADECAPWETGRPVHRLAVGRPSGEWVAWAAEAMAARGVEAALVVTLEVGQYLPRQRNLLGAKEVQLGTGHRAPVPWLTSLETPVSVLQLTGALVDRSGRALRIAAEGVLARRTSLPASSLGLQALIGDEEVARARAARRDYLPGRPLAWQVALEQLVAALLGGPAGNR
jgi:hypothetical protein